MSERKQITLSISLALVCLMFAFQNCERPYDIVNSTNTESGVPDNQDAIVINGGEAITNNATLEVTLNNKGARDVSLSTDPSCRGTWVPYTEHMTMNWTEGDGLAQLYVRFTNFGKEESECFTAKILVDTAPPIVVFLAKPNALDKSRNPVFELNVNEAISEVDSIECRLQRKGDVAASFKSCDKVVQLNNLLGDADYTLSVRATDSAGNVSPVLSYDWTIDTRIPGLTVSSQPVLFANSTNQQFQFTVDNPSNTVTCMMDTQVTANCKSPWSISGLSQGLHKAHIEAADSFGNIAKYDYEFTVDTLLPTVAYGTGPKPGDISPTARVNFSSSDGAGSGVTSHLCKLDIQAELPCSAANSHTLSNLAEGNHSLVVTAVDRAGNRSLAGAYTWSTDLEPATLSTGLMARWPMNESSASSALDVIGGLSGLFVNFQASPWMPNGGQKLGALAFDNANIRMTAGDNFSFDGTAPFSIAAWVYRNGAGNDFQGIANKIGTDSANKRQGWTLGLCNGCSTPTRGFACERYLDGGNMAAVDQSGPIPVGEWTHVVCTYTGSRLFLYRNGLQVAQTSTNPMAIKPPSTSLFTVGANLRGRLDEVRVYNRAITKEEALSLATQ